MYILHAANRLLEMREHIITSIDAVIRKHPDCGIIVTGDVNQLNEFFFKTHYRFVQIVNVGTRGNAVLDNIWTNVDNVYMSPVTLSELGTSYHNMVLLKPGSSLPRSTGSVMRVTIGPWARMKRHCLTGHCLLLVGNLYLG